MSPLRASGLLAAALLAALASATPVRSAEIDRCLPDDSEIFVSVNVRQILDSELMKKYGLTPARDALRDLSEVEDILKDLGFDPFKDLDRVIVGSPTGADKDRGLLIAHGRFDLDKFKAKADESAQNHPDSLRILQVPDGRGGKERVYEVNAPQVEMPLFVAIPNTTTFLVSPGKDYVVDAIKKLRGSGKTALKNKDFQNLLEKMDDRQSLSVAAVSSALKKGLKKSRQLTPDAQGVLDQVRAVGGGISLGEDVKLEVAVTARSERQARELAETARQYITLAPTLLALLAPGEQKPKGLDLVEDLIKSLRVSRKGLVVLIKGRVGSDTLEETFKRDK
jgi:hypothetical protein